MHHLHRSFFSTITASKRTSLSLGLGSDAASGFSELEKSSESLFLVGVAEESLLLDDLGGVVNIASKVLLRDGGVALRFGLSFADAVLGLMLRSHGESSLEILCSLILFHGDSNGIAHLTGIVHAVAGESGVRPVLAVPLGLLAVESLGNSPDNVL